MEILIRKVRTQYRKAGKELKYICRMGIGKRGGPHMHILVNRFATEKTATDLIFSRTWTKGHVNFKTTYDAGGYRDLAEYITKSRWKSGKKSVLKDTQIQKPDQQGSGGKGNKPKEPCRSKRQYDPAKSPKGILHRPGFRKNGNQPCNWLRLQALHTD